MSTLSRARVRARASCLALALAAALAVVLPAPPASAAPTSALIVVKGPGASYSGGSTNPLLGGVVSEAVRPGGTTTFQIRIINYAAERAQYKLLLWNDFLPAEQKLMDGTTDITALAESEDGWVTSAIPAGGYQQLSLKVAIPDGSPPDRARSIIQLRSTTDTDIGFGWLYTIVAPPADDHESAEVYARQGSQLFVGGASVGHIATSPAVKLGAAVTFDVKLRNDLPLPNRIRSSIDITGRQCFTVTAKHGTADITSALVAGQYVTASLGAHRSESISVTMRRTSADPSCLWGYVFVNASDDDGPTANQVELLAPTIARKSGPQ